MRTKYLTSLRHATARQAKFNLVLVLVLVLVLEASAQTTTVGGVGDDGKRRPLATDNNGVLKTTATVTGGGDASAANQTATQANPGSNATKATAVQGVDGGKAVPVSGTFWQATQPVSVATLPSHAVTNAGTFAVQPTAAPGASTLVVGQVALSTSATQIKASDATRRQILVRNLDSVISIYLGGSGVTSANGMLLKAGESMTVHSTAAVYAIAVSGTPSAAYVDEHD